MEEVLLLHLASREHFLCVSAYRLVERFRIARGTFREDSCVLEELCDAVVGGMERFREMASPVCVEDARRTVKIGDIVDRKLEAVVLLVSVNGPALKDEWLGIRHYRKTFFQSLAFGEEVAPKRTGMFVGIGKIAQVVGISHRDDMASQAMRADGICKAQIMMDLDDIDQTFDDGGAALEEGFAISEFRCHDDPLFLLQVYCVPLPRQEHAALQGRSRGWLRSPVRGMVR